MAVDLDLVKKVFSDEEFVREVAGLSDPVEVQATLKAKGIDLSIEEIQKIGDNVKKNLVAAPGGELDLDQLDEVAGGSLTLIAMFVVAAVAGVGTGVGIILKW